MDRRQSRIESDPKSLIDDQRTFDSRISPYGEKARSKAWSSVAQASPPTKHLNSTSADAIDENLNLQRREENREKTETLEKGREGNREKSEI